MKNILVIVLLFCGVSCDAMEAERNNSQKSFSPGPTRKQISQHARHRSLSGKVLDILHLRTDEIKPLYSNVAALIYDRSAPDSPRKDEEKESPKKSKSAKRLTQSNALNVSPRKQENNRDAYVKDQGLAFASIKKITSAADAHEIMKSKQYMNSARFFYKEYMRTQFPDLQESWLDRMADEEFRQLQEEFDAKIASIKITQQK
jgi:hypothetical protein